MLNTSSLPAVCSLDSQVHHLPVMSSLDICSPIICSKIQSTYVLDEGMCRLSTLTGASAMVLAEVSFSLLFIASCVKL